MINIKEIRIVLKQSFKWGVLQTVLSTLDLYQMGLDMKYINVAVGIDSSLGFQVTAIGIIATIFVAIVALSFGEQNARHVINKAKVLAFICGFILLNKILTPVLFIIAASIVSSEFRWIPIALLMLVFPYLSIVFMLLGLKVSFRGLRKEAYHLKPLSIA